MTESVDFGVLCEGFGCVLGNCDLVFRVVIIGDLRIHLSKDDVIR